MGGSGWQIVAALNRADPKVGQYLGTLTGLEAPSGILVQDCNNVDLSNVEANVGVVFMTDLCNTTGAATNCCSMLD